MIDANFFLGELKKRGIKMLAGVPDSLLSSFCAQVEGVFGEERHFIMANEGNAIGIACGHYLATDTIACVYMQNSGLGNAVNPLTSLADELVYEIPILLIIGWRGEPGKKDEPQHIKQGLITEKQLELLNIPYYYLNSESNVGNQLDLAFSSLEKLLSPVAILVSSGTFSEGKQVIEQKTSEFEMTREQAIKFLIDQAGDADLFVSTTGKASRELYEARCERSQGLRDFLTVGSMGHASSIALGIALSVDKNRRVYCLDGDGAALMHLGAMPVIGSVEPKNLVHIVLNNGSHESVGGQPTVGYQTDFVKIARASGYQYMATVSTKIELQNVLSDINSTSGPIFIEIKIQSGSRKDLGRPSSTPQENKTAFMKQIREFER